MTTSPQSRVNDEATILRLEDRRQLDRSIVKTWSVDPDPVRRARIALALGRIGTATFDDANGNGRRDTTETMAGVPELIVLASDQAPAVRGAAAFALGEIGDRTSIDALFTLASDSDPDVAANATEGLSKMAVIVPFARYQALASTEFPPQVRAVAIRYLFRFGTDEASGLAAMLLESLEPAIRLEATYTLSRRAFAPARRKLEALLHDDDLIVRAYAARALGVISSDESLRSLSDALNDNEAWVRTNAVRSIGQLLDKKPGLLTSELASATARQLAAMSEDLDAGTRASTIETMGRFAAADPGVRAGLLHALAGSEPWLRERAALALAKAGLVDASSPLIDDSSPWVRARVVEGTSALPQGEAIRARLASSAEPLVRAAVIGAIPDGATAAEKQIIVSALEDRDVVVRATALGRLGEEPFRELVTAERLKAILDACRTEAMNDARVSAVEALAAREFQGRAVWLASLIAAPDPVVRRIAAERLEVLDGTRLQYTPLPVERPLSEYEAIARWAAVPHSATIRTTQGDIDVALSTSDAPLTTWNFAKLAEKGYFNATTFMRVVPNFVLQGGDPRNDMSGGPGYAIRDEINQQRYMRGTVGMALSGLDTGGSQFFITHSPQPHLDGGYTVFGQVVGGMSEVADRVERGERVETVLIDAKRLDAPKAGVPR
ncbi:MAG: peptidylprolyl isomerase [Thermoanaerobaculia bacterium]|jgi:cyclophilin family peptidyl-prolyl cis-trans isomerase